LHPISYKGFTAEGYVLDEGSEAETCHATDRP